MIITVLIKELTNISNRDPITKILYLPSLRYICPKCNLISKNDSMNPCFYSCPNGDIVHYLNNDSIRQIPSPIKTETHYDIQPWYIYKFNTAITVSFIDNHYPTEKTLLKCMPNYTFIYTLLEKNVANLIYDYIFEDIVKKYVWNMYVYGLHNFVNPDEDIIYDNRDLCVLDINSTNILDNEGVYLQHCIPFTAYIEYDFYGNDEWETVPINI